MTNPRVVGDGSAGTWSLSGDILTPTHATLQQHAARMQQQSTTDPLITLTIRPPHDQVPDFPSSTETSSISVVTTTTVHASLLDASAQLSALKHAPSVAEWPDTFHVLRRFLYLQPIDVSQTPPDAALAAKRWGLPVLQDALFCLAGDARRWLCVMASTGVGTRAPPRFRLEFVRRFVRAVDDDPTLLHGDVRDPLPDPSDADTRVRVRAGGCPTSAWAVLAAQELLPQVARALVRFGDRDYGPIILHRILAGFDALGERVVRDTLVALNWETGYGDVLRERGSGWHGAAWRVFSDVRDRVRFGWDDVRVAFDVHDVEADSLASTLRSWETTRDVRFASMSDGKAIARLTVGVLLGRGRRGLVATVRGHMEGDGVLPAETSAKRVRVAVSVGGVCGCVDDGIHVPPSDRDDLRLRQVLASGGLSVRVTDAAGVRALLDAHRGCDLRVAVRVLLERDVHAVPEAVVPTRWSFLVPHVIA